MFMKVIDLTYLHSVSEGNTELEYSLVDIFLQQIPEFSQCMDTAFRCGDYIKLAAVAHKAKSSVLAMGMEQLATSLKLLEMLCKQIYVDDCDVNGVNDTHLQWYRDQIQSLSPEVRNTIMEYREKKVTTEVVADLINFYNLQTELAKADIAEVFPGQSSK